MSVHSASRPRSTVCLLLAVFSALLPLALLAAIPKGSAQVAAPGGAADLGSRAEPPASPPPQKPKSDEANNAGKRQKLLAEGLALRRKGDDRGALERFEAALVLGRDARVLAQIALAEEALGRWAKSYLHLQEALTDAGHKWIQGNSVLLQAELKKIEAELGRLDVAVNIEGAEVTVDGERVGTTPLREPVVSAPGTVVISVAANGFVTVTRPVVVTAGELTRADISLVPVAPPPVVAAPVQVEKPVVVTTQVLTRQPLWLYVAGGGAVVALASIGPWLGAARQADGIEKDCTDANGCDDKTWKSSRDKVQTLDRTANALLYSGLAIAALATGAYFLFPRRERRTDVRPSAWLSPTSFGVSVSGGLR